MLWIVYSVQPQLFLTRQKSLLSQLCCYLFVNALNFYRIYRTSIKVLSKILQVILGLETTCLPSCKCILLVKILFGEPRSRFTNFHSAFDILVDLFIVFCI
jgi:hypothetical protein